MSEVAKISTGYSPRKLQQELHRKLRRFSTIVCHRRFGKTVFAVNDTIDRSFRCKYPNPQYAYLAPFRDQAKRVAWEYFKRYTEAIPGVEVNEAELRIDIPRPKLKDRIRYMLLGADNPAAIKGIYLDGGILDEYGEMYPAAWREAIRPTLSDRLGWATFIGTPKGRNNFWDLHNYATNEGDPEWFGALYKASETGIIIPSELESARRAMTEDEYEQEYECSFQAGLVGAYFSKEISALEKSGKFTSVPYDPSLRVETFWDLGINDTCAIWFVQRYGREYRMVDYFEEPDLNIPKLVSIVKDRVRDGRASVGDFWLPHDAKVRDLSTGKTRIETFKSLGIRAHVIPRVEDKMDSIHAARMMLPRCVFDAVRCKRGIDALMNYQRKWDSKALVFSQKPMHNWASNGADAFQQFAMGAQEEREESQRQRPAQAETQYDIFA